MSPFEVTADGGPWRTVDRGEVLAAARLLFAPGTAHELRSLPSGRSRLVAGDRPDALADAAAELADGARGLYYTLNPVRPDLGDRAARNADVLGRRWLMVDVDPVKAEPDASSTETEKAAAWGVSSAVVTATLALGWPEPVVIDSGNGWHLLYRVDLPNDPASAKLIAAVLKGLAKAHDTDAARVDTKVHNAARIAKLPGTMARKGVDRSDRPHRPCRVLVAPDKPAVVPAALLAALAGPVGAGAAAGAAPAFVVEATDGERKSAYARSAVLQELARVAMAAEGNRNDALNQAAFSLGTLAGAGAVDRADVEAQLVMAAGRAGLGETEARRTVRSGLDAGAAQPRALPEPAGSPRARGGSAGRKGELADDGLPVDDDVQTVCLEDVEAVPVEWLWPNRIPIKKLTLLAGLAKQGKSFFTMDLAARVSSGEVVPCGGGLCFERGSVVLLSAEDDLDDTVKPRLVAAGADCRKVHALTTVRQLDGTLGPFNLGYIPHLERAIIRAGDCKLVIIDPVTHYIGGKIDDHKVAQLRAVLGPLKDLAAKRRVAVLVISHFNKGSGTNALHRVIGSSAYTALARANWMIHRDPKDPKRRLLLDAGTNLAEDPGGLAYRIVGGRLEWEETPIDMTADQALQVDNEARKDEHRAEPGKADQARDWLANLFAAAAELPSADVLAQGKARGFSRDSLFEAKKELGIGARKGQGLNRGWLWVRPDAGDTSDPSTLPTVPTVAQNGNGHHHRRAGPDTPF